MMIVSCFSSLSIVGPEANQFFNETINLVFYCRVTTLNSPILRMTVVCGNSFGPSLLYRQM